MRKCSFSAISKLIFASGYLLCNTFEIHKTHALPCLVKLTTFVKIRRSIRQLLAKEPELIQGCQMLAKCRHMWINVGPRLPFQQNLTGSSLTSLTNQHLTNLVVDPGNISQTFDKYDKMIFRRCSDLLAEELLQLDLIWSPTHIRISGFAWHARRDAAPRPDTLSSLQSDARQGLQGGPRRLCLLTKLAKLAKSCKI